MKVRPSLAAPLMVVPLLFLPGIPLIWLREQSPEARAASMLALVVLSVCLYLGILFIPVAEIYQDRFRTHSRGWSPWHRLGHGERFVICRGRLQVMRFDGTLRTTRIAKWSTAGRHWRRLEQWFPTVDGPPRR